MRKIARCLDQHVVELIFGVRQRFADRYAFTAESRRGYRDEQAFKTRPAGSEVGETDVDCLSTRQSKRGKTRIAEPLADPARCRRALRYGPLCLRTQPCGACLPALPAITPEAFANFVREFDRHILYALGVSIKGQSGTER